MAKSKSEVVAFNAGELGKEALARVDLENYARGAEIMENIFPLRQGGMTKMPGTLHVTSTPSNAQAWVRPFVFSDAVRFGLEITADSIRFISDGALVSLTGAAATLAGWTDQSAAAPTGGGTAPDGGTGDLDPVDPFGGGIFEFGGYSGYVP
jgi:hypothetical protein